MERVLSGGNTHERVVLVDGTVRRPTGPWTAGVHALLRHLEQRGFDGAPRLHGLDEQGREVLEFIEGDVVHPDQLGLMEADASLADIAGTIRQYHDAASGFAGCERFAWSDRGGDPRGRHEIVCHNDLAPWNLVRARDGRWVFIDWDLAAPGRRAWDLAWALLSVIPLMPGGGLPDGRVVERVAVFRDAYGPADWPADVLSVAVERCEREAALIDHRGAAGAPPYDRLLREGHGEIWRAAAAHTASRLTRWRSALS